MARRARQLGKISDRSAVANDRHKTTRKPPDFPHQIWCRIFVELCAEEEAKESNVQRHGNEQFRQPDRSWFRWLLDTRNVCRDFNNAIVPVMYETIDISTTYLTKRRYPNEKIKGNLANFSKFLHLPHEPIIVWKQKPIDLIKKCKSLKHIQWTIPEEWFIDELKHFTDRTDKGNPEWQHLTLNYLIAFLQASKEYKHFHLGMFGESVNVTNFGTRSEGKRAIIEDLKFDVFGNQAYDIMNAMSPEKDSTRDDLDDTSLELLYITAYHDWDPSFAASGFRLPGMHSLILKCSTYSDQNRYDFLDILDFTELERLALLDTQVNRLIEKVHVRRFSNLRALHLTVSAYPPHELARISGAKALRKMFGTFHQLDTLYVSFFQNWIEIMPLSVIAKTGKSLRKLSLRNTKDGQHPAGHDMRWLSYACPNIEDLTVDIDLKKQNRSAESLAAFTAFQNLHTLTLYSSTVPDGPNHAIHDDRVSASATMTTLHTKKQGVKFRQITLHLRWIDSNKLDAWKEPTDFDRGFRTFYSKVDATGTINNWDTEEVYTGKPKKKQKGITASSDETGYDSDSTVYGELGAGSVLRLA
ncbi:hypothetical protein BDZ45DRAFT_743977 [Acephala macrosclerotiorum]|nr:hypothetical protein BDZ45DRAFT_743977 [Acephala macrosclerotiorum]